MDNQKEFTCMEAYDAVYAKKTDVENDFQVSLPAYADDIYRVVKCVAHNYVTSADIHQNEVKIFAKCEIALTYYNEESGLCFADFEEAYTKTFNLENLTDAAFVCADICDKYTNYRVINQRRIDVHSSAQLSVTVYDKNTCSCLNSCEHSRMKTEDHLCSEPIACQHTAMEFDESFSVPADSPPIKRIVSRSADAAVTEIKIIKDKALIKAAATLTVLYTTDESEESLQKADYHFTVTKIIDVSGVNDKDKGIGRVTVGNLYLKAKAASGEKLNTIDVVGELMACVLFVREVKRSVITDGYILHRACEPSYSHFGLMTDGRYVSENKQVSVGFDLNADVKEIRETSLEITEYNIRDGQLSVHFQFSALCSTLAEELTYCSAGNSVTMDIGAGEEALCGLGIVSYDYTLSPQGRAEVRATVSLTVYTYSNHPVRVLTDISAGDELEKAPSLTVYFGRDGEELWDIAKAFSSDEEQIRLENGLEIDRLDDQQILIIPRV